MAECPHLKPMCYCGARPNSPDCKGDAEVDLCELHPSGVCDLSDWANVEMCWRWQEHRAEAWKAMAGRLVEELAGLREYLGRPKGPGTWPPVFQVDAALADYEKLKG